MNYKIINTISQYEELLKIHSKTEKEHYFRYTMMQPLKPMWDLLNVPLKAKTEGGYDVVMATRMLGYLDVSASTEIEKSVQLLKDYEALQIAERALNYCLQKTKEVKLLINAEEIIIGLYISDEEKSKLYNGYTGFGGIPGFITLNLFPTSHNIPRIPALLAHEFHHNIRFSNFSWDHGNVTVGDYIVIEGLAESFAKELYGEDMLGPWVTSMDEDDLAYSTIVIGDALDIKGFAEVSSYMYGDEIAKQQGYQPVGLSFCAGYAVGYHVVQSFLQKQNKTIYEATLCSTEDILTESGVF